MGTGQWNNRISGQGEEDADQLLANPRNFRLHPKHQQDALEGVLNEVGWVDDVIVNQRTGFVIDGHLRVSLAQRRGEKVPVKYVDLTDSEEALILATFDPISALAIADKEQLDHLLREVTTSDAAVMQMLADLAEESGVVSFNDEPAGLTDADDVPEPPADPITKPGDLWTLGRHRLLCGDSTNRADVDRLMGGAKADMVFTDPPYNVGYKYSAYDDHKTQAEYVAFLQAAIPMHCNAIVNNGNTKTEEMALAFGKPFHVGIWLKLNAMSPSAISSFSVWEPVYFYGKFKRRPGNDVFDYPISNQKDTGSHTCPKPLTMCTDLLTAFHDGGLVYDPFLGSGSTLIACEQLGRTCYGMELDPIYCDVIVRRWENHTGETASREAAS